MCRASHRPRDDELGDGRSHRGRRPAGSCLPHRAVRRAVSAVPPAEAVAGSTAHAAVHQLRRSRLTGCPGPLRSAGSRADDADAHRGGLGRRRVRGRTGVADVRLGPALLATRGRALRNRHRALLRAPRHPPGRRLSTPDRRRLRRVRALLGRGTAMTSEILVAVTTETKSARTRSTIIDAALRLLRERGYEATTMRMVAAE